MKVLGYNGGIDGYPSRFGASHNAAAALVVDGDVVAAVEEERLTRIKHDGSFPRRAMEHCLHAAGLRSVEEVDLVAYYYSYPLMFRPEVFEQHHHTLGFFKKTGLWATLRTMQAFNKLADYDDDRSRESLERNLRVTLRPGQFAVVPHHVCHTASTFYDAPFESALCLTLDAQGESACSHVTLARGTELTTLREVFIPNSLGYLYTFITAFLGFEWHDEYKVMGLAPYGNRAVFRQYFRSLITLKEEGAYDINSEVMLHLIATQGAGILFPREMVRGLGAPRRQGEPCTQRHMDIAAGLQEALEETVMHTLVHFREATGEKNLCLAGGVALNSTMNGRIVRSGLFDRVWVHPAAHDGGTCVGAALYGFHNVLKQPRTVPRTAHSYLGPGFSGDDVTLALSQFSTRITHRRPDDLVQEVAQALAGGKVVGWYQGQMEWGPRALGNRSILADPRREDMKDIVNHAVKLREGFRPFAPAVLEEEAYAWFDLQGLPDSPSMLFVVPVLAAQRARIPAVTHVDGSARVQTVREQDNPRFHALIQAFRDLTGVPVVLNTSFNVKGEPIVNTPSDAVRCFLGTQIDLLVLGDTVIAKRPEVTAALARDATSRVVDGEISAL